MKNLLNLRNQGNFMPLLLKILIDYTKKHEVKMFWRFIEPLKEYIAIPVINNMIQIFYLPSNEISLIVTVDEC
jgi:hypothetical protein